MDRFTRWSLVAVAVLVGVAVWAATRSSTAPLSNTDEGPAAVTREWFAALANGRPEDAWALLAPESQLRETRAEFLRRHSSGAQGGPGATRMRIERVTVTGDEARVEITRSHGSSSDFPFWRTTVSSDRVVLRLRLVEGRWRVTVAPDSP
jgi:hypothetical protein